MAAGKAAKTAWRWFRNAVYALTALIALLAVFVMSIHPVTLFLRPQIEKDFFAAADKKIEQGEDKIYFRDVANFDWDTVCVLSPYTPTRDEKKLKQLVKADISGLTLEDFNVDDDSLWKFIFIADEKIVGIIPTMGEYYFKVAYNNNCMGRDHAGMVYMPTPEEDSEEHLGASGMPDRLLVQELP
ncbi:MAG: hypothetical protein GC131_08740 [Alphaproteobacteria bacterium]|nr:hypothetical protein [Alphaproteobacteria bacterium]